MQAVSLGLRARETQKKQTETQEADLKSKAHFNIFNVPGTLFTVNK